MEPENQQDNFDLKFSKLEIDLSPPTRGQRSLSSRCITGFDENFVYVALWRRRVYFGRPVLPIEPF